MRISTRPITPACSCVPRPFCAHEADGVRIVHHHHRVVLVGQIADLAQGRDVAVHGKHAVGGDQAEARALRGLQLRFQIRHVAVLVAKALGLAQPDAVDDGGVIQLVGNHGVFGAKQRFKQSAVGVEAGRIENGVFRAEKAR